MTSTPEQGNTPRRFSWLLLIFAVCGLLISVVFIILSFSESGSRSDETGVSGLGTAIPGAVSASNFTTLPPSAPGTWNFGGQGNVQVGQPAPDFTLRTLDGGEATLSDYLGRPVLINFWASWCPPCRIEMPDLVRAYETHKAKGFVILAVDLTFQDTVEDARAFVEEFNMTFPVLLDESGEVTQGLYQIMGLPMSVFVNRVGIVSRVQIGAMTADQVDMFVGEIP